MDSLLVSIMRVLGAFAHPMSQKVSDTRGAAALARPR